MSYGYFRFLGVLNGHNIWYWYWENPELHECAFHSPKVTVWCSVTSSTINGFHIFENKHHAALTVMPKVTKPCLRSFWFLQWAIYACTCIVPARRLPCLTQLAFNISMDMLQNNYPGWLISRFGDIFGLHNLWTWWPLIP